MVQVACTGLECTDHWGDDDTKNQFAYELGPGSLDYWKLNNKRDSPPTLLGCLCEDDLTANLRMVVHQEGMRPEGEHSDC